MTGYNAGMLETKHDLKIIQKGAPDWMNLSDCPYCNLPGMVTTVKSTGAGLEMQGKCTICGYSYDSDYSAAEPADDLPGEYSRPLEHAAAD